MPADLCVLADEELLRRVENLPNLSPSKLPDQLAEIGAYFALIGALDDAVRGWDLGDRHLKSRYRGWWEQAVRQHLADPNTPASSPAEQLEARNGLTFRNWGIGLSLNPASHPLLETGYCCVYVHVNENDLLRIRVFDSTGARVADADETQLSAHAASVASLKQKIADWCPSGLAWHTITAHETDQVLDEVLAIFGLTRHNLAGCAANAPAVLLHDGLRLARPLDSGDMPSAEDELAALELLKRAFVKVSNAHCGVDFMNHGICIPIAADIAARHGRKEEAVELLQKWHGLAANNLKKANNSGFPDAHQKMSRFPALVTLICEGALRDSSKLTPEQRADLIARIDAGMTAARESPLPKLKSDDGGLVLRTDFSDAAAWERIGEEIRQSLLELWDEEDSSHLELVSDPRFKGWSMNQIKEASTSWVEQNHLFVVDAKSIKDKENRVLVIDLGEKPGRTARVLPSRVGPIFAELSTQNASWGEVVY